MTATHKPVELEPLDYLLELFEPHIGTDVDRIGLVTHMSETLTGHELDTLDGLMLDVWAEAERRGGDLFMRKMDRALKARQAAE